MGAGGRQVWIRGMGVGDPQKAVTGTAAAATRPHTTQVKDTLILIGRISRRGGGGGGGGVELP